MKEVFAIVVLMRVLYSGVLLFAAFALAREVRFVWFDRHLTFGDIKYFDGTKIEENAGDRFRYLLSQEYNHALDHIREYKSILETLRGGDDAALPNLLALRNTIDLNALAVAKNFESFEPKRGDFAQLDLTFQGIDFKKLFSSVRTYLSPSVDVNLLVTKNSGDICAPTSVGHAKDGRWKGC